MNLLVFFNFEPKSVSRSEWDERFSATFAMSAVLATSVTPCYPL